LCFVDAGDVDRRSDLCRMTRSLDAPIAASDLNAVSRGDVYGTAPLYFEATFAAYVHGNEINLERSVRLDENGQLVALARRPRRTLRARRPPHRARSRMANARHARSRARVPPPNIRVAGGRAFVVPVGPTICHVLDVEAENDRAALCDRLASGRSMRLLNESQTSLFSSVLAAAGWRVAHRQVRMRRRL